MKQPRVFGWWFDEDRHHLAGWAQWHDEQPAADPPGVYDGPQTWVMLAVPTDEGQRLIKLLEAADALAVHLDLPFESVFGGWRLIANALTGACGQANDAADEIRATR